MQRGWGVSEDLLRRVEKLERDMWVGNGKPGMTTRMALVETILQAQTDLLADIRTEVKTVKDQGATLLNRSKYWSKANFWKSFAAIAALVIALAGVLVAYADHHTKTHPNEPIIGAHSTGSQSTTADSR
jgi:anti-sigma-K factor RskA